MKWSNKICPFKRWCKWWNTLSDWMRIWISWHVSVQNFLHDWSPGPVDIFSSERLSHFIFHNVLIVAIKGKWSLGPAINLCQISNTDTVAFLTILHQNGYVPLSTRTQKRSLILHLSHVLSHKCSTSLDPIQTF